MSHDAVTKLLFELHKKREVDEKPFSEYAEILAARDRVYAKFQNRFSQEKIGQLSAEEFGELLSFKHNEHWTGLQRSTAKATADMPRLHRALEYLFDESVPLADRIDTLTDTNSRLYIHGVNIAVWTPRQVPQLGRAHRFRASCCVGDVDTAGPYRKDKVLVVRVTFGPHRAKVRKHDQ